KELMRRNPRFDGKMRYAIRDDVVTELFLVADHLTDIAAIRVFNSLNVLDLHGEPNKFTPRSQLADLTPLKGMNLASLTHLNLYETMVTDAAMVYFKDSKYLVHINVRDTDVTDTGLANFKGCRNLGHLNLDRTQVTDKGLAHFNDCTALTHLLIGGTNV